MNTKILLAAFGCFSLFGLNAQQVPTVNNPFNGGINNGNYWSRGGNSGNGGQQNNIFGTRWNSPIYFITAGLTQNTYRARLNGTFTNVANQYQINNYSFSPNGNNGINTSGYMALGFNLDGFMSHSIPGGGARGPYSILHLNGRNGTFVQSGGFRPWMKTGVTFTDNNDLSYMGLRKLGPTFDKTETTITWSDNAQGASGPDDMVFRFTSTSNGNTNTSTNFNISDDLDGLHVARFTGTGLFGLGNTFGINVPGQPGVNYATPRSLAHLSMSNRADVWMQFTNRANANGGGGTGEFAGDGLRIGILGNNNNQRNGNALIYQQENRHLLFSTNANTNNVNANNTRERMRITAVNAPTELPGGGGYGQYNPGGINGNRTRVSISHNPNNPVTRPLSLVHIGYNTGGIIPGTTDGWRSWMDVGTFTAQDTDNMYVGLKNEGNDQKDAVINWGDNQPNTNSGPDHLRFIYTNTTLGFPPGDPVSTSQNGREMGRFFPGADQVFTYNLAGATQFYGRFGIGNFAASGVNEEPTQKLDVIGNGRFRYLPDDIYEADASVTRYVMVDADGVLRWQDTLILPPSIDTTFLDCVTSELVFVNDTDSLFIDMSCLIDTTSGSGTGIGFLPCPDTTGAANLTNDSKVNMNDFTVYFEDGADSLIQNMNNRIGVGYDCGEDFPGKISIDNKSDHNGLFVNMDGVTDLGNYPNDQMAGISSIVTNSTVIATPTGAFLPAIHGRAENNSPQNVGAMLEAYGDNNVGAYVFAGDFSTTNNFSQGMRVQAVSSTGSSFGGTFFSGGPANFQSVGLQTDAVISGAGTGDATGIRASASGPATNYGVHGSASGGTTNYAGYFQGDVFVTGAYLPSDENLKENIQTLSADSSSYYIDQLNPSTFNYQTTTYPEMNLSDGHQYGMIAQEVEAILPSLVTDVVSPTEYDSLGNVVTPSMTFKGLNYEAFIPILVADAQNSHGLIDSLEEINDEQNGVIEAQDSLINDLNERLSSLESCLSNILPYLCQLNNTMVQQNNEDTQNSIRTMLNVELSDKNNIVLDQNVPNPFAEQTIITYSIPEAVAKAQIHFYNVAGQLIKSVEITERGAGQLNVFGSDLSRGIYTYTLVADGQIVATKKMEKMGY